MGGTPRTKRRGFAGPVVAIVLGLALQGCTVAPTKALSTASIKQLFGIHDLLNFAYPGSGSLVAVGAATVPGPAVPGALFDDELVVGGAVLRDSRWWVRSLQEYLIDGYGPQGCATQIASGLVPGGPVIIAQCLSGGTDGVGFVVVVGRPKGYAFPVALLATTCGGTRADVKGAKLILYTEGPQPGAAYPGAKQPTFVFTWQRGTLQTSRADFYKYCASPDDYAAVLSGRRR